MQPSKLATKRTPKGDKPADAFGQREMDRYLAKLSGPLIDRIDIHVEVPKVPYQQLTGQRTGSTSADLRQQVLNARAVQHHRNGGPLKRNAVLTGRELDEYAALDDAGKDVLKQAMTELGLSARAYDKVRRLARTIADLDNSDQVQLSHVAEAISYRLLDRER
ncbi:MAG: ATP-binding protein [Planctomycetota bacterium]